MITHKSLVEALWQWIHNTKVNFTKTKIILVEPSPIIQTESSAACFQHGGEGVSNPTAPKCCSARGRMSRHMVLS
jgi:hypothetical protein